MLSKLIFVKHNLYVHMRTFVFHKEVLNKIAQLKDNERHMMVSQIKSLK